MHKATLLSVLSLVVVSSAYQLPSSLGNFYNSVKNGGCSKFLDGHNNEGDGQGNSGFGFCTDHSGIVYLSGPGEIGDMDTDCDGSSECGGDGSHQSQTAFDDILQSKGYGVSSLAADHIPYVVLGTSNTAVDTLSGGPIEPLSVVAVVCNGNLQYGVFGDTNGDHSTGEAAISLGRICFPDGNIGGDNGHTDHDVLYVAFTGKDAIVGPQEAPWTGSDPQAFMNAIRSKGDRLVARAFGGSAPPPPPSGCSWHGHCIGASCGSNDDCSDALICVSGKCANTQNRLKRSPVLAQPTTLATVRRSAMPTAA